MFHLKSLVHVPPKIILVHASTKIISFCPPHASSFVSKKNQIKFLFGLIILLIQNLAYQYHKKVVKLYSSSGCQQFPSQITLQISLRFCLLFRIFLHSKYYVIVVSCKTLLFYILFSTRLFYFIDKNQFMSLLLILAGLFLSCKNRPHKEY